jgi:hypothetical protein
LFLLALDLVFSATGDVGEEMLKRRKEERAQRWDARM